MPASERAKLAGEFARELRALPFQFVFPLHSVGPKQLAEMLKVLRSIRPLRRRDIVGQDAGWVPTDTDAWCFRSEEELAAVAAAWNAARQGTVLRSRSGPLLLGTTLHVGGEQRLDGPLWTASVGVEWAYGPAADPLQLGLRLGLHCDGRVEVDLDIGSGGWSPWAEHWALLEDTLTARIAIVSTLPNGEMSIIRTEIAEETQPDLGEGGTDRLGGWACEIQGCEALRHALVNAGEEGVRTVISIGSIRWQKDPPEWCPAEVRNLVLNSEPVKVS